MAKRELGGDNQKKIKLAFFVATSIAIFVLLWGILRPYLLMLSTAAVAAIIAGPLHAKVARVLKGRVRIAAVCTTAFIVLVIGIPLVAGTIVLTKEIGDWVGTAQQGRLFADFDFTQTTLFLLLPHDVQGLVEAFDYRALIATAGKFIVENTAAILASASHFLFFALLFFFSLYYFLAERDAIKRRLLALSPLTDELDVTILHRLIVTIRAVVVGNVAVGVVQGILAGIGFALFGFSGAAFWGFVTVIAAQVPVVGTGVIVFPAAISLALSGSIPQAIGLFLWGLLLVGTIDNVLKPQLIQGKTKMHPLAVLLSMLGGLQFFGPTGFILGPTVLAAALAFLELYEVGVLEGTVDL